MVLGHNGHIGLYVHANRKFILSVADRHHLQCSVRVTTDKALTRDRHHKRSVFLTKHRTTQLQQNTACRAALAVALHLVTACSDYERFRGRTTDQVKQACDPQRQTPKECSRTLDR